MKIKVAEATGPVLDWMVAYASGAMTNDPELRTAANFLEHQERYPKHCYQRYWAQGGPIIERAKIHLLSPYGAHPIPSLAKSWLAHCLKAPHLADGWGPAKGHGPTPLIAAMRCFVTSKLGDEVEVPDELA